MGSDHLRTLISTDFNRPTIDKKKKKNLNKTDWDAFRAHCEGLFSRPWPPGSLEAETNVSLPSLSKRPRKAPQSPPTALPNLVGLKPAPKPKKSAIRPYATSNATHAPPASSKRTSRPERNWTPRSSLRRPSAGEVLQPSFALPLPVLRRGRRSGPRTAGARQT